MNRAKGKSVGARAPTTRMSIGILAQGIAQLHARLDNYEAHGLLDSGRRSIDEVHAKLSTASTLGASGPSNTISPGMGYIDRFVGNVERLVDARLTLEDIMRRLGILEPQPPSPVNPSRPGNPAVRDLLEEFNQETHRLKTLLTDLNQAF